MLSVYGGAVSKNQSDPGVPGHDSFYHTKMAALLPEIGLIDQFPWLKFCYFTETGDTFISHHYGFHMLLVPFVTLSNWLTSDYLPGARWAMAFFLAINLVLFNEILAVKRVRWRWVWLFVFLLMPSQFFTRHAYVRAIGPSLVLMQMLILFLFQSRYILCGLIVALYTHLYLGGVIYAPLLVILFAIALALGSREDRSTLPRVIGWTLLGWIMGIITHPYSGGMWEFLMLQVFGSGLSPDISVGREWKSYEGVWWFAQFVGPLALILAAATITRLRFGPPIKTHTLFLLLANLAFLTLTMKARRFVEYWPFFCLLCSAMLAKPMIDTLALRTSHAIGRSMPSKRRLAHIIGFVVFLTTSILVVWQSPHWISIRKGVRCKYDLPAVASAMQFLQENSEPGDVVFTDDWDVFPVYFYYNSHNHYIVGLDPKFTQARKPELWERYVKVSRGQVPGTATYTRRHEDGSKTSEKIDVKLQDIREHFGAKFVITDRDHKSLAGKLNKAKDFAELIYPSSSYTKSRNKPYLIFRIQGNGVK